MSPTRRTSAIAGIGVLALLTLSACGGDTTPESWSAVEDGWLSIDVPAGGLGGFAVVERTQPVDTDELGVLRTDFTYGDSEELEGVLWLAEDPGTKKTVAIQLTGPGLADDVVQQIESSIRGLVTVAAVDALVTVVGCTGDEPPPPTSAETPSPSPASDVPDVPEGTVTGEVEHLGACLRVDVPLSARLV